jgi:hypothetical protein
MFLISQSECCTDPVRSKSCARSQLGIDRIAEGNRGNFRSRGDAASDPEVSVPHISLTLPQASAPSDQGRLLTERIPVEPDTRLPPLARCG